METKNAQAKQLLETKNNNAVNSEKASDQTPTLKEIQAWITAYIAELMEVEPKRIDIKVPFDRYGLDSSAAIGLTGDLETWLDSELDPTLLYDYPTIKSLSEYISESLSQ
jgi:acyl carrier protein